MSQFAVGEEGLGRAASTRRKLYAALVSITVSLGLVLAESLVALFTGSLGVLADAGHSGFDMAASLFAYWGIRIASAPPDRTHHYGHEKFENLSSLVQMALLVGIATFIVGGVAVRLYRGFELEVGPVPIVVVAATLLVDFLAARYLGRVAREERSFALEADSYQFLGDMWTKIAVLVGLGAASLGQIWLDPAAALAVAGFMLFTAFRLGHRSTRVLLDEAPHADIQDKVRKILLEEVGQGSFHSLRLRQAGKWVFLDLSLHVPARMTVAEAHERAHHLSRRLRDEVEEVREAVVHIEPEDASQELEAEHSSSADAPP